MRGLPAVAWRVCLMAALLAPSGVCSGCPDEESDAASEASGVSLRGRFSFPEERIVQIGWGANGEAMLIVTGSGDIWRADCTEGRFFGIERIVRLDEEVVCAIVERSGRIIVAGVGGHISSYSDQGDRLWTCGLPGGSVLHMAAAPDGNSVAVLLEGGRVLIFEEGVCNPGVAAIDPGAVDIAFDSLGRLWTLSRDSDGDEIAMLTPPGYARTSPSKSPLLFTTGFLTDPRHEVFGVVGQGVALHAGGRSGGEDPAWAFVCMPRFVANAAPMDKSRLLLCPAGDSYIGPLLIVDSSDCGTLAEYAMESQPAFVAVESPNGSYVAVAGYYALVHVLETEALIGERAAEISQPLAPATSR